MENAKQKEYIFFANITSFSVTFIEFKKLKSMKVLHTNIKVS